MYSELINELCCEFSTEQNKLSLNYSYGKFGLKKEYFSITKENSNILNRPVGDYVLLNADYKNMTQLSEKYFIKKLSENLRYYITKTNKFKILVVGLGNRHLSSDKLGPAVLNKIKIINNSNVEINAIAPSVSGLTGIETADIIEAICNKIKPNYVLIIDSLCASDVSRLGKSIQLNNGGIYPGAGVDNKRKFIDKNLTKCEVVIIGVPLVVYAKTLVESFIKSNGFSSNKINHFTDFDNEIVTLKDIDFVVEDISRIIASAINSIAIIKQ